MPISLQIAKLQRVAGLCFHFIVNDLKCVGSEIIIIRITKREIPSSHSFEAIEPALQASAVFFSEIAHTAVRGSIAATDPGGFIRRSIVNEQQFKIPEALAEDGINASREISLRIINGDDYGKPR